MRILAIDTCNETCSVALWSDGDVIQRLERQPRMHAKLALPMVQTVLDEAGIALSQADAIGFGAGPGSFTGLRIAAAITQGLAFGADLPVVPISTLAAMATMARMARAYTNNDSVQALSENVVMAGFDARMGEIYYGIYQVDNNGGLQVLQADAICAPTDANLPTEPYIGVGSAWQTYAETLSTLSEPTSIVADAEPTAAAIAELAATQFAADGGVAPELAQPVYLRNNVAKKSTKYLPVKPFD